MTYKIKDWHKFQHFKDRKPPWIKLYRDILDDLEWHELDPNAAKALVGLWIIASESDGVLPNAKTLAFRLRISETSIKSIVSKLSHWLMQDDISVISERYQSDSLETETETETEKETEAIPQWLDLEAWKAYCKHRGSKFTENAKALTIKKLEQFKGAGHSPKEILETSIANGWKGIFEPKAKGFTPVAQAAAVDFAAQRAKADIERTRQMLDNKLGPQLRAMP